METIGLNPQRLVIEQMSAAEGGRFVELVTRFSQTIRELGPLKKEVDPDKLKTKLQAAKNAVEGKKMRWVVAKRVEFMTDGNLYGEVLTQQELNRLFEEVVLDELAIQEILLLTREQPLSVRELAEKTGLVSAAVLRRLTDMKRMGLMQVQKIDKRTPLWKAVEKEEQGQ